MLGLESVPYFNGLIWMILALHKAVVWVDRVESEANPADSLSRFTSEISDALGVRVGVRVHRRRYGKHDVRKSRQK